MPKHGLFAFVLVLLAARAHAGPALETAQAAMRTGQYDAAVSAGRSALGQAQSDGERLAIARLIAAAHFRAGQFLRAEYWLRRALEWAETPAERAAIAADFEGLRLTSPFRTHFTFSVAPNSNINNGSSSKTITIWGLPFILNADARPLAGLQYDIGVDVAMTVSEDATHLTELGLAASGQMFTLSPGAKKAAPDVKAQDYSFAAVEVYGTHSFRHGLSDGPARARLSFGQNWYGGDPYTRNLRLDLSQELPLGPRTGLSVGYGSTAQWEAETSAYAHIQSAMLGVTHLTSETARIQFSFGREVTRAANSFTENSANRADAVLSLARVVEWAALDLRAGIEDRTWPVSFYGPDGRQDITVLAGADLTLHQVSAYGFQPILSFEARQTRSNVDLYDRQSYALSLGLQSQF